MLLFNIRNWTIRVAEVALFWNSYGSRFRGAAADFTTSRATHGLFLRKISKHSYNHANAAGISAIFGGGKFDNEAIQTRGDCVAKNAPLLADRPDPSLRKRRLLKDDKANCTPTRFSALCLHASTVLIFTLP